LFAFKRFYENQETWKDYNTEQHNSPKNDGDKMSIKKNKTVMSKLKKKALRFSKIFSPGIIYLSIILIVRC
jgi:hypothetical protein